MPKVDGSDAIQDSESLEPSTPFNASIPCCTISHGGPPSSASSPASSQRFPLTKQNLLHFNSHNNPMSSPPNSESRKTRTTTTSSSETVRSVRRALGLNNIYIDDTNAKMRATDLIEKARALLKGKRHSALKNEQGLAIRDAAKEHACDNDMTFLIHVWRKLLSVDGTRLVKSPVDGQLEEEEEANQGIEAAWEQDHLKINWKAHFTRRSVPPVRDPALQVLALYAPPVKNPKPDITYGFLQHAFSDHERFINKAYGAALSVQMDHPFFVVEAMSAGEPMEKAENQCARGGAAMVRLKRKFDGLAEGTYHDREAQYGKSKDWDHLAEQRSDNRQEIPVDHYRTDAQSFAFSLAINSEAATIFVHWAEEAFSNEGQLLTINWHANHLEHYNLNDPAAWIEMHRDVENLLDWGVLTRKQEMKDLCNQIYAREGGLERGDL